MLIVPQYRGSDIDNINEYKELDRRIIIYETTFENNSKNNKPVSNFSLMNVSIQNGNVGGFQSRSELLYTVNMYYGHIDNPLIYSMNNILKPTINLEACVRIHDYGFAHKMINKFSDTEDTTNHLLWMTTGKTVLFKDKSHEHDENRVITCDPRFYNLDHQIIVTDDDQGFYTNSGLEIGLDSYAKNYGGVGYILRELVDKHTHIYVSKIHIDDPYKLIKENYNLLNYVNDTVCKIQNFGLLALAKSYTVILDKELGFNIKDLSRLFELMDKRNERFEVMNFMETVKTCYETLQEMELNIRLTIIYKDSQTNISVLPIENGICKSMNENISDIKMYEYTVDTLISG